MFYAKKGLLSFLLAYDRTVDGIDINCGLSQYSLFVTCVLWIATVFVTLLFRSQEHKGRAHRRVNIKRRVMKAEL